MANGRPERSWVCPVCALPGHECGCGVDRSPGCGGDRWRIAGTRLWLRLVRDLAPERFRQYYPHISAAQYEAAVRWIKGGGEAALLEEHIEETSDRLIEDDTLVTFARLTQAYGLSASEYHELITVIAERAWHIAKEQP